MFFIYLLLNFDEIVILVIGNELNHMVLIGVIVLIYQYLILSFFIMNNFIFIICKMYSNY
jgi:hypothetical protein